MLALLLARQGISVTLLEAHTDFDRAFRGDTLHPSVLHILDEIGLSERVLQLHHSRIRQLGFQTPAGKTLTMVDFDALSHDRYGFIAIVPQAAFLDFIVAEAKKYAHFQLVMGAQVDELLEVDGQVAGVRYRGLEGRCEVRAVLTVGADGRFSRLRKLAGFKPIRTSPPMDVLWLRLSRRAGDPAMAFGRFAPQRIVAVINRDDYWQIGCVIPKGHYQQVRAAGIEHFRDSLAGIIPELADRLDGLQNWQQVSVLSVESDRLPRWYRPGLLLIGDAAHVMSPVGGVGINYAIQDAVVASNVLGGKLKYGVAQLQDLARVQRQRQFPTRFIQLFQAILQKNVLSVALNRQQREAPLFMRIMAHIPMANRIAAHVIGYGIKRVHVKAL
ncbi:monooxygenase [Dictyobacter arantiisoli]|uniref:Monooxygenase n=2 Tax=Dictyobacter arantiisoli TaxID=2014874 RepID=A0A5A5TKM0_9CHLR|nr:monooxygenase [Dictyobacter arantiisoli]